MNSRPASAPRRVPVPWQPLPMGLGLLAAALFGFALLSGVPMPASAQAAGDPLDRLVREALATHPEIRAARSRVEAASARTPRAGALPDPTLSGGLMSVPLPDFDLSSEGMTMFSVEIMQRFPPRGLRRELERAAEAEAEAALAEVEVTRWSVTSRLQEAYFELLLVARAEEVHHLTHSTLEAFASAAATAYRQGLAPQRDILRAQTELSAIEEHLAELRERRGSALAEVNALLGRDSRAPVQPVVPERLRALLEADPGPGVLSAYLAHQELGGGFPTLAELQERALERRPELVMAEHRVTAAHHGAEAARLDRRPGFAVMAGYGLRNSRPDLFSAGVSVDLPVFRSRKQDQALVEAERERDAFRADREALVREIRREVAQAHAGLIRARERVILLDEAVIPQARATVESAAAAYRSGEGDFTALMEVFAVLLRSEIDSAHLIADVGRNLTMLERAVGAELTLEDDR
jgi:outer membrane protein, heavy metal efflux system